MYTYEYVGLLRLQSVVPFFFHINISAITVYLVEHCCTRSSDNKMA